MITLCHPVDALEVIFLRAALDAEGIPHLIVGEHFGSLYPGIQIPIFNERVIRVPDELANQAAQIVERVRATYEPVAARLVTRSKFRMLFEALWFGWMMPGGRKKPSNDGR